jgi:DNA polymerase
MPNDHKTSPRRSAADYLPDRISLASLRRASAECQGCDLYKNATQTVFGEGRQTSRLMLVGEMPGDQEDKMGRPFVGPAGMLLDGALEEAGLSRRDTYVTNVVKHFKWEERGKRRLHKKPGMREVVACRAWLEAEIFLVQPTLLVCLGATAAQALLGKDFRITKERGRVFHTEWADWTLATHHPSAILRAPEKQVRDRMRAEFVLDLQKARDQLNAATGVRVS